MVLISPEQGDHQVGGKNNDRWLTLQETLTAKYRSTPYKRAGAISTSASGFHRSIWRHRTRKRSPRLYLALTQPSPFGRGGIGKGIMPRMVDAHVSNEHDAKMRSAVWVP
jgi:hypothetical protein